MPDVACIMLDVECRIELYPIKSYPILSCKKKLKMSFEETENSQLV